MEGDHTSGKQCTHLELWRGRLATVPVGWILPCAQGKPRVQQPATQVETMAKD